MEQQVKERLTGGVILVVLLVLLVPELLTGPHPVLPPVAAQPDQAPLRSYTMDLGESPRTSSGPVAASTIAPSAPEPIVTSAPLHLAPAPAPTPAPEAAPAAAPARAVASAPARAPTAAAARVAPPPAAPTARVAPPPVAPPARVSLPPAAPARGAGAWTVQLGTFSSRENAARLVSKLKSHGFNAAISEAAKKGHTLYRVRLGTERDRAAAQRLQARLRAAGEKGGEIIQR